ncbi:MAG: hypothetical protein ABSC23_01955 [Bryobacteraceae bacterium]|jgi:hypothetical protein
MKRNLVILIGVLVCLFITATARAEGSVTSDGKGNCVTVTFYYDDQGKYIGVTTTVAMCDLPAGVYPFRIATTGPGGESPTGPTPLDPTTLRPLAAASADAKLSLRVLEVVRAADRKIAQSKPAPLARDYVEKLRKGKQITVDVPNGYLSPKMMDAMRK